MEKFFIKKIRLILWLILVIVVGFLLYQAIAPSGKIVYAYDFSNPDKINYFINKLTPKERLKIIDSNIQTIIGEPVYFSLRTLRKFDKAKITLQYQNPNDLPLIELGLLKDKKIWRYNLKPITNKTINQLIMAWHIIYGKNGEILLEKEKKYQTVDDFLKNPPPINEIATYNYNLKNNYLLSDYKSTNQENKINQQLRGPYQFYTYIKNEKLDLKFIFSDLNRNKNNDPIELNLYYQDKLIDSKKLNDNNLDDEGRKIDRGMLNFNIDNLSEGAYKIELLVNDDIITEQIISKQSKLSFINRLWLADGAKNIELKTDSNIISAQTINPASLQTIKVGDSNLVLTETYQQFDIASYRKNTLIKLEKGDIMLSGNGVFSFNQDSFFEPMVRKVDNGLDINANGINYVITEYQIPKENKDWQTAEVKFDLTDAYREGPAYQLGDTRKMSFLISIPGLRVENPLNPLYQDGTTQFNSANMEKINDKIIIGEIKIELSGKSLFDKIKRIFYDKN